MAHLAREHLVTLLGPLARRHVEEDAEHDPVDNAQVTPLAPGGDPQDLVTMPNTKVDLVGFRDRPGGPERVPHPLKVFRMNMAEQLLEGDGLAPAWHAP